jgi:hypothetical protein
MQDMPQMRFELWNFYLGMNYIDARNKYRAALRRSGRAYSEAFEDA